MNILSLSSFVPEQICDTIRFTQYRGSSRISHYCGYLSDFLSQALEDPEIDGAVFPRSCDSSRTLPAYLSECGKFYYQIPVPSSNVVCSTEYLAHAIKKYKSAVESFYGISIDDVRERANQINIRNAQLSEFYQQACADGGYSSYLAQIHHILKKPLYQQKVEALADHGSNNGKKVFLVGSFLPDLEIVRIMENSGLQIAGDNLTESKRLFSAPAVQFKDDIFHEIADSIQRNRLSPTQNDFQQIVKDDLAEICQKNIKGVIFITQKFCEPYDYLFFVYQKALAEINVPVLHLVGNNTRDYPNVKLMIEAFADKI